MLILKLSQKKYKDVSQTMKNHKQKLIKSTQIVDMGIRSSVVMMTNTVNQYRSTEVKMLFINSWKNMLKEVNWCKSKMKKHFNKPLKMTMENEIDFKKAIKCHICDQQYTDKDIRVRDHCLITGKFRGSAHQDCNLKLRIKPDNIKIPVIFHNLRGYDSHFIMQQIGEIAKKHAYKNKRGEECQMNINCIPNNMEKYLAFMLGNHLIFLDSLQFMNSSLDNLIKNLPDEAFKYTKQEFEKEQFNLMKQKGIYPYDHMDSFDRFNETKLPVQQDFYSILNNEHISDEQ